MKGLIIIGIVIVVGGLISVCDRLREIIAHQRVIESMLDDIKKK